MIKYSNSDKPEGLFTYDIVPWFTGDHDESVFKNRDIGDCVQPCEYDDLQVNQFEAESALFMFSIDLDFIGMQQGIPQQMFSVYREALKKTMTNTKFGYCDTRKIAIQRYKKQFLIQNFKVKIALKVSSSKIVILNFKTFFILYLRLCQYVEGHWKEARELFEKCLELHPVDGPSKALKALKSKFRHIVIIFVTFSHQNKIMIFDQIFVFFIFFIFFFQGS